MSSFSKVRSSSPLRSAAIVLSAALGLLLPGAAQASGQTGNVVCRVVFTEVLLEPYNTSEDALVRSVISGHHNFNAATGSGGSARTEFRITDTDGFFVLTAFSARWRDRAAANDGSTISVPRGELEHLVRTLEAGEIYFDAVKKILMRTEGVENRDAVFRTMVDKQLVQSAVVRQLNLILTLGGSAQALNVPSADIFAITSLVNRWNSESAPNRLLFSYKDAEFESRPQRLCHRDAESAVVGSLLCRGAYADDVASDLRDPLICPQGLIVGALPPPV